MTPEDFSQYAVGGAANRADSFTGLNPQFSQGLYGMLSAAHAAGIPLQVTSAYRSPELQGQLYNAALEKYGSPEAARKWVAPPGRSQHNFGTAADFAVNGSLIRDADSPEAQWIRNNAEQYGLAVPMDWEPWQVELQGARNGPDTPQAVAQDTRAALGLLNNGGGQMTPEQKPQGLLGALGIQKRDPSAGGETAKPFYQRERFGDVLANLAPALGRMGVMGLEGPAQAALDARRSRQGQAAQVNKTREWLLSQPGGEKFAGMIEAAGPQAALQAYMQAQQGPEQTSAMQNYQYLIAQGVSPQEAMASAFGGGGSTVNVNTAPALDTRPITAAPAKDYQRVWDEQSGTYRDIVIPGTDTARQLEQAGAAGATGADQTANTSGIVLGNIDAVRDKINSSALPVTGAGGAVLSKIPGTNAYDVGALISTLNSNIAFDRLQAMRDASPTGGALGAVSAPELELLRSSIGSLDQAQSEEQFIRALDIVEQQYKKLMEKAEAYPNASAFGFGSGGSGGGSGLSEEDMRYLNGGN